MYDIARHEGIPLMAGSSLPVSWRVPAWSLPLGSELTDAFALGYGDLDAYGFHGRWRCFNPWSSGDAEERQESIRFVASRGMTSGGDSNRDLVEVAPRRRSNRRVGRPSPSRLPSGP